ncbi:hypothetical protein SO802_017088 [Lithocarpus litseifolius]|uniref:Uncharacterized protein n=1 Tax=Lithocarpus litseifolius TaxID=425828 RepID=A0AAW2CYA6_9ROSI
MGKENTCYHCVFLRCKATLGNHSVLYMLFDIPIATLELGNQSTMADTNSFVFAATEGFSCSLGTINDVKDKRGCRICRVTRKGGKTRSHSFVFGGYTVSSATNQNLSNYTPTTPFCNPFSFATSSVLPHTTPIAGSDHAENSGKDSGLNQQNTLKVIEDNSEPVSCPPLPLKRISRILKGIPHNPHFLQLRSHSEAARKNLMAGWDRAFEETVEEIHSLTANDFWVRASEMWKTMEELQSLGYNVLKLRKRLVELTEVMVQQKLSQLEIRRLKVKAESHRMEMSRLENVILGLQIQVEKEQLATVEVLKEVAKMENELPKFDSGFASLAMGPL